MYSTKTYGYNHSPEEVFDHAQKMKYDGIEVHNRFEEFPDPVDNVAIARHKNHLSGYGGS